jgi:transposase-like protein
MMMHLSKERTIFICYHFYKQLRTRYGRRKPIHTDGAHWYNDDACKWLRLKHHVYGAELKNVMERFIQQIKDMTQNALMTIFLVEKRNLIDNTSITG